MARKDTTDGIPPIFIEGLLTQPVCTVHPNQELIAQGLANIAVPFFGAANKPEAILAETHIEPEVLILKMQEVINMNASTPNQSRSSGILILDYFDME